MKLKNKKTGEIVELVGEFHREKDNLPTFLLDGYGSLVELNEEWEDYEEPKEYWYMDYGGRIKAINDANDKEDMARKSIGNYFETKEEAERAVEKLKALANLRKRGLKFGGWDTALRRAEPCNLVAFVKYDGGYTDEIKADLDLLFCPEENS